MRRYDLGDPDLDERIRRLATDAVAGHGHEHEDADLITEMLVTTLKLYRDHSDRANLKLVNAALKEMRYSFVVFAPYRSLRKVAIFGSARTASDDPNYLLAMELGRLMTADRGWMVITGAGPGTMEAANRGAGSDASFGVNIRLPFEAAANPYIDEARLINYKYFFTRKLTFAKESQAFAMFPGGFGTLDETFEILTLIQTGKAPLQPIVLIEAPGTGYWKGWLEFVTSTLVEQGMITPEDLNLFISVSDAATAADEICRFYRNYHSRRFVNGDLILRVLREPDSQMIEALNDEFSDIVVSGRIEAIPATETEREDDDHLLLGRIRMTFDRRNHGRLRLLVNRLNEIDPEGMRSRV